MERQKESGRNGETDRKRVGEMERQTEREWEKWRDKQKESGRNGETDRKRVGEMERQTEREWEKWGDRQKESGRNGETDRKRVGEMERQTEREWEKWRDRQKESGRNGETDRKRVGEMERQTEREWEKWRDRQKESGRNGETDRKRVGEMERQTEREWEKWRDRQKESGRNGETDRKRVGEMERQTEMVSIYQKWSKEGTVVTRRQGHGRPRLTDTRGERRLARVIRSKGRATVAQIAEEVNAGSDRKVSEYTVHHSLLCMGPHSRRPVSEPMMTPVHLRKCQQWAREYQNWTVEQWKKVTWSDESHFLLHHVDCQVHVRHLPGEHMAPGCTMGSRRASGGSVMLWSMFCWETLGPAIHVDVTLTRSTYLSIVAEHLNPFMETVFPDGCGLFQQDNAPCHKAKMVQEWFDEHNNQFEVLTWPPNSPDLNPTQLLWDVLDKQVRSMEASPHNFTGLKGSAANMVPDPTAHLQGSSGVHALKDEPDDSSPVSLSCEEQNEQRADEEKNEPSGKEAVGSSGRNVFARMLKAAQRYLADTSKQSTAKRRKSQSKQSQNASVSRKGPFTLQDGDGGATEDSSPMPLRRLRSGPVGRVARRRSGVQVQSTRGRSLQHRTPRTPNSSCTKPGRYEASVEIQETPHSYTLPYGTIPV
ncbi:hypothetical protein QTP70_005025 [Hemibagrus guttatus]|uniref:Tc1-like transposase DDE domain-containing protein n=1 Tax=Hemibagrus guttatus TaxID=175788 RepID=A0AAE0V4H2_9TELE|nr:hypothetical protein QTP70_005025 [Hemibagrus guttatus]